MLEDPCYQIWRGCRVAAATRNTIMRRTIWTAAFALTVFPSAILRADEEPAAKSDAADPAAMFTELDSNKDGQLSADEVPEERKRLFDRLVRLSDKDGDEKLNADEFAAGLGGRSEKPEEPPAERAPREGRPGDGRFFDRLDANGDGKVSA